MVYNKKNLQSPTLAIGWAFFILLLCSIPASNLPKAPLIPHLDKVVHVILFAIQLYLLYTFKLNKIILLLLCISYGAAIEYYQLYCIKGRSFDVWDIVADACGALLIFIFVKKN
jgi:VanZ family protein